MCYFLLQTFLMIAHSSQTPSSDSPSETSSSSSLSYLSTLTWHSWFYLQNTRWSSAPHALLTLLSWPGWLPPPSSWLFQIKPTHSIGSGLGWSAVSPSYQACWAKCSSVALPRHPWIPHNSIFQIMFKPSLYTHPMLWCKYSSAKEIWSVYLYVDGKKTF